MQGIRLQMTPPRVFALISLLLVVATAVAITFTQSSFFRQAIIEREAMVIRDTPWAGFGASDRPLGISRPLFQKKTASPGSPFFLWNLDEMAAEIGYHSVKTGTTISARLGNGIVWKEDGSGKAEPAQGGGAQKVECQSGVQRQELSTAGESVLQQ